MPKTSTHAGLPESAPARPPSPLQEAPSEMALPILRFQADLGSLTRFYTIRFSPSREERLAAFYRGWRDEIEKLDFERMSFDGQTDWLLLKNHLDKSLRDLQQDAQQFAEAEPLVPFAKGIIALEESRRRMETLDPRKAADHLHALKKALDKAKSDLEKAQEKSPAKRSVANRAAGYVQDLRRALTDWNRFYSGYLPLFDWWCAEPYKALDRALGDYFNFLKEKLVGIKPDDTTTIVGDPIGNDALLLELQAEMIPYTPDELVKIAEREFAWCDVEMLKASQEMGFGSDWKMALEKVKATHVEPGEQPELVRKLALEAIAFVEERNLVTVPELAKETWRMEMMSPERQLQNPFFLGGEQITVSFPTSTMSHEQKLMSLRANNVAMSRATVQHELIPGHHLQGFMNARHNTQRRLFGTPFWTEGWALYWEMLLWDLGFPRTPEERVGMLFWRMHRCARIIFSLNFHLEKWSPEECVKFLIERVGHEPDSAAGEVRRSFAGNYGPLYQAAYMLGGLQFRELHKELVGGNFGAPKGRMSNREFHDAILRGGSMPVAMVRAMLTRPKLSRDYQPRWRF